MEGLEFNVSTLLQQSVGTSTTFEVSVEDPLDLGELSAERTNGAVRLTRTNFGILARANIDATVRLECDRCLEPYKSMVTVDFSEEFLPVIDVSTGRPVQSERADEAFSISPNHIVDLAEAARQHILLAVPMHKICRENCQGLCPVCGWNKNVVNCQCSAQDESPFSALAALLAEQTSDN